MDELFDKIKDGASKTMETAERLAKEVAKRTSNAITSTKLSYSINEANEKIKDIYAQIGKAMYDKYNIGDEISDFAEEFEKIAALMHDIKTLQAKKAELKNTVLCKNCDTLNSIDSEYCSKCGEKLDISEAEPDEVYDEEEIDEIIIEPKED